MLTSNPVLKTYARQECFFLPCCIEQRCLPVHHVCMISVKWAFGSFMPPGVSIIYVLPAWLSHKHHEQLSCYWCRSVPAFASLRLLANSFVGAVASSAMLSHMACQCVAVQSVHLLVPCSQVTVTCTSACSASLCSRTARHMYCSTASNKHLADTPT